ncbi:MAG TPA: TonB-dependent receptor plug domain-containing protein, partial [Dokdonella sp.]|nr:TonB-dependent receptor plug domain-containing protein [Dokdonella sp.]
MPALLIAAPLHAQAPESNEALEVITVTAQRRAELLQTTPVSVTALAGDALVDRQIDGMLDVAAQVPNLRIEPVTALPNAARVFLRGVGEDQSTPTTDGAIGFYVDGVFHPRMQGAIFDFSDVERIEVLRGPQGTLYGRNTSGGAIKIITADPDEVLAGSVDLTVGSFDRRQIRGTIGGPIADSLKGSLSLLKNERDGNVENVTLDRDVNSRDTTAVHGKLIWSATD